MYKLIRFFNQNRKRIIRIILIIVFLLVLIQLLNYFAKNKNDDNNMQKNDIEINNFINKQELVSDKSAISGKSISQNKLENDTNVINEFLNYCNKGNIESAYELLTNECKEEMFPTIESFKNIYYKNIFNEESKSYTIENWVGDVYQVSITGDILSTGKIDSVNSKQDYMTIVKNDNQYKLNINNYIGRTILNKEKEDKGLKIKIKSVDTYMDYEIYNIYVENNSNDDILLDTGDDSKSIYLQDSKDVKYYFYNNEIIQSKMKVESKYKKDLQIKFSNSFSSNRSIKNIIFSKMVLNYKEYINLQDKTQYDNFYQFKINV